MRLPRRALLAFLLVAGGGLGAGAAPAAAAPCDQPIANEIACENTKPGNPASEWDVSGSGSAAIQGFATDISVDQGETVAFKVDTPSTDYRIDIYRLGYYGGSGARKVATIQPSASLPQTSRPARRRRDRPHRLRQLGASRRAGRCRRTRSPASTSPSSCARTGRPAPATWSSSCATTTAARSCCSRPPTRPGRPTTSTAATASTSAAPPGAPTRSATTGRSPRAGTGAGGLGVQRRVPDGPLARAQRLRRQLHDRRRHRPARRRAARARDVPVRRPRRVLVGRPARERRGGARAPA